MNRPHYDLHQQRTKLERERGREIDLGRLTRLMFPFCWRICVREVAGLARLLLLLAEPVRGEKEPPQPPPRTSSDFSISAFWKYNSDEREGRGAESVQSNIIISAVAGLD